MAPRTAALLAFHGAMRRSPEVGCISPPPFQVKGLPLPYDGSIRLWTPGPFGIVDS